MALRLKLVRLFKRGRVVRPGFALLILVRSAYASGSSGTMRWQTTRATFAGDQGTNMMRVRSSARRSHCRFCWQRSAILQPLSSPSRQRQLGDRRSYGVAHFASTSEALSAWHRAAVSSTPPLRRSGLPGFSATGLGAVRLSGIATCGVARFSRPLSLDGRAS